MSGRTVRVLVGMPLVALVVSLLVLPPGQAHHASAEQNLTWIWDALPFPRAAPANVTWVRQFGTPGHSAATIVAVAANGDVVVVGWGAAGALPGQTFAGGVRDAILSKYSSNGDRA